MRFTTFLVLWLIAGIGAAGELPNIILIVADDLGYGDVGVYGAERIRTPAIDRLAADGVRLTNFYTSGNVCTPSRAGMLTGRYSIRMGLANKTITTTDPRGMPPGETTIAEILQGAGYSTALIGKWHLGHSSEALRPNNHGFDYFFGLLHSNDAGEKNFRRNEIELNDPVLQDQLTARFTSEAVDFILAHDQDPFFLYLSYTAPHKPIVPASEYIGRTRAGPYGDVIAELDDGIARILSTLSETGIDYRTLVVFTSDNGPFPEGSTGGLRGGKGTAWDGGYRVPMVIRWPGRIRASSISEGIAMNIDLLPTLANAAGIRIPELELDGKDILPMIVDKEPSPHDALYLFNNERIAAVRTQDWRLVLSDYPPWRDARPFNFENSRDLYPLLFDMNRDPGERYNLSRDRPEARDRLLELLENGRRELEKFSTLSDAESYVNTEKS